MELLMITQVHIVTDKGYDDGSKIAKQFGKLCSMRSWILYNYIRSIFMSLRYTCLDSI